MNDELETLTSPHRAWTGRSLLGIVIGSRLVDDQRGSLYAAHLAGTGTPLRLRVTATSAETRSLAQELASHPNPHVMPVSRVIERNELLFIAGPTLARAPLEPPAWTTAQVVEVLRALARGLAVCHVHGVRLVPTWGMVFVGTDGTARLDPLGLSGRLEPADHSDAWRAFADLGFRLVTGRQPPDEGFVAELQAARPALDEALCSELGRLRAGGATAGDARGLLAAPGSDVELEVAAPARSSWAASTLLGLLAVSMLVLVVARFAPSWRTPEAPTRPPPPSDPPPSLPVETQDPRWLPPAPPPPGQRRVELPAPVDGKVVALAVAPGSTVAVGDTIAWLARPAPLPENLDERRDALRGQLLWAEEQARLASTYLSDARTWVRAAEGLVGDTEEELLLLELEDPPETEEAQQTLSTQIEQATSAVENARSWLQTAQQAERRFARQESIAREAARELALGLELLDVIDGPAPWLDERTPVTTPSAGRVLGVAVIVGSVVSEGAALVELGVAAQ